MYTVLQVSQEESGSALIFSLTFLHWLSARRLVAIGDDSCETGIKLTTQSTTEYSN